MSHTKVLRRELPAERALKSGELLYALGGARQSRQPGTRRTAFRFDLEDAGRRDDDRYLAPAEFDHHWCVLAIALPCFLSTSLFPSNLSLP